MAAQDATPSEMAAWQYTRTAPGMFAENLVLTRTAPTPTLPTTHASAAASRGNTPDIATSKRDPHLLVRVHAVGLNPIDIKFASFIARIPLLGTRLVPLPATPGLDFAGQVIAVSPPHAQGGSDAEENGSYMPGTYVFGRIPSPIRRQGALAEYVVVRGSECAVVPSAALDRAKFDPAVSVPVAFTQAESERKVTVEEMACVGTGALTAYRALAPYLEALERRRTGSSSPQTDASAASSTSRRFRVFINGGSGGCGTWAVQIARRILKCYVVASCSSRNASLVQQLGADVVLDYTQQDIIEELVGLSHASTNETLDEPKDKCFDLVVDFAGTPADLFYQMHRFTKPDASFVQVAMDPSLATVGRFLCRLALPSFLGGGKRAFSTLGVPQDRQTLLRQILGWMRSGQLEAVVDTVYDFDSSTQGPRQAYEKVASSRARGKLIVRMPVS